MAEENRIFPNLTPQQEEFLISYTNPNSGTFGNALQSALKVGYSQEYAESITHQMPDWLSENLGNNKRLKKAERVLDKTLEYEPVNEEGKIDTRLLRVQTDTAKFIASTVGKAIYSTRKELTGEGGKPLFDNLKQVPDEELADIAYGSETGTSKKGVS